MESTQTLLWPACVACICVGASPLIKGLTGQGFLQVFKSGDEDSEGSGMSVEDYPSQEVALRVQLQRAIEEERLALSALKTTRHLSSLLVAASPLEEGHCNAQPECMLQVR